MSYTYYIVSKSILDALYRVRKCLTDSLSVLSEVTRVLVSPARLAVAVASQAFVYPLPERKKKAKQAARARGSGVVREDW